MPLVEAMAADVPVLAYAAGAVPETLGGAGVLFAPKDLEVAAEMLGTLVYDRPVRDRRDRGTTAPAARISRRPGEQQLMAVIDEPEALQSAATGPAAAGLGIGDEELSI